MDKGTLFVVATPIGNLADITLRALEILKGVHALACEDTRQTQKLLARYAIAPRLIFSLHKFNEKSRVEKILRLLEDGKNVALVSDGGTPALSDPGQALIAEIADHGFQVEPVPGPCALIAALSASGFAADRFLFDGFLPRKKKARCERLLRLKAQEQTLIFFEAPHRLRESLKDMLGALGNRKAVMARELTKLHEEIARGSLQDLWEKAHAGERVRGEIVILVEGSKAPSANPQEELRGSVADALSRIQLDRGLSRNEAMREIAQRYGISRNELYKRLVRDGVNVR